MNAIHRLVWNATTSTWVAAAENARSRGKRSAGTLLLAASLLPLAALAQPAPGALPTGGQIAAGQAAIQQNGAAMTIQQGSDRAAIDWQQFNVGRDASVRFQQPSAQSVTLNRVQGPDASQIFGRITANGQVFLSNPNGVYFAPGASVDVGGLVATTHRISLDDFMAGRTRFERQGATGSVVNEGELRAALGGYIALLAPEVRNQGIVVANLGTVALAAGEAFELQFDANHTLAGLRVEGSTLRALVDNRSAVLAPGGLVILSAQALDRVQGGVVRNSGRIEATGLAQRGGRIVLEASSQVANSGSISASATAEGPAGSVRLQAPEVVNSGSITATGSAAHPQGGRIEIVADTVRQTATGSIDASGPTQGGTVHVRAAAQVELAGRVAAQATLDLPTPQPTPAPAPAATAPAPAAAPAPAEVPTQGGSITIEAAQITLPSASLDASGGRGGSIVLDTSAPAPTLPWSPPAPAPEPGKVALLGTTQLSTRGRRGGGGSLTLLGDDLALKDHTALDASGSTGGGTVLVGGGWQGTGGWHQATTVTMEAGARIDASATQQGHGGTVVLWSDVHRSDSLTTSAGSIRARGGAQGGDGGRIETSGHAVALEGLAVDAGAAPGQGGTGGLWLIDPTDSVINQTISNGYAATLNTGTSVLNEVIGTITWNSGVSLATTAGGAGARATLTLRSGHPSTSSAITLTNASITATGGALDLVLWTSYNTPGFAGPVRITGSTINTNGGHVWVGGGNAAGALWNGLAVGEGAARTWTANEQGVFLDNTSISTGAGSIHIAGQSFVTTGDLGGQSNIGVWLDTGTTLTTSSGAINVLGQLLGSYATATGLRVGGYVGSNAGNVRIETGSGSLTLDGTLQGTPASWGHGLFLDGNYTAGNQITVRSGAGAIVLNGSATPTGGSGDVSGLQIHGGSAGGFAHVVSTSGGITLRGSHSNTTAWYSNGIRFTPANTANSIRIGDDGGGSYSGNILVESDSLLQRSNLAGSGSIAVQTTGALAIQSVGASFTRLRAGDDGGNIALTFDNDWNFGTTLSSLTLGRNTNTANLTLSNALTVAGSVDITAGALNVNANIQKTSGGDATLTLRAHNDLVFTGAGISSSSGKLNMVLIADWESANGGATYFNGSGTPITLNSNGGHVWIGGNGYGTAFGSTTWNGLTVGTGLSNSSPASGVYEGVQLNRTTVDTAGGNVYIAGRSARFNGNDARFGVQIHNSSSLSTGAGSIDIRGTLQAGGTGNSPDIVGVDIYRSSLATTSGAITITGGETANGDSGNSSGIGVRMYNASVTATTGAIAITGTTGTNNGGGGSRDGLQLFAEGDTARTTVSTTSGAITLAGTANVTNQANSGGIVLKTAKGANLDVNNPFVKVVSQSGHITLTGDNPNNTHTASSGIAFNGANYGRFYIGQDETGTHSGSLTLTGRSVTETNMAGGYLRLLGSGALTIEPLGSRFVRGAATGASNDFGSLWSFGSSHSAITLGKAGNTSDITVSSALSVAGPISIFGGNLNLNANLSSTLPGAGVSARASGSITTSNAITLTTSNGALLLAADTDGAGGGLFNATGTFTANTSGGAITIGGGDASASGYATGFASGGTNATGIRFRGTTTLNSGGGHIRIKGKSFTSGGDGSHAAAGLWTDGNFSINSGTGTVYLEGVGQAASTSDYTMGMMFGGGGSGTTSISSANTTASAITLIGDAATAGNASFNSGVRFYTNGTSITATGLGGGITLQGTRNTAGNANDISFADNAGTGTTSSILANGGPIHLKGTTAGGQIFMGAMTLGRKAATAVPSSASNITITADGLSNILAGTAINTSGTLTVRPSSNSFSGTLNWPLTNLTLSSDVSGLTLGKDVPGVAKTDTININAPQNIAGPIAVYGGAINVNAALTAAGDVTLVSSGTDADLLINVPITSTAAGTSSLLLKSARNVSLAAGGSITAAGGPLNTQFWADSDRTGDGINRLLSNIDTNGGWLKFGNDETATINGVSTRVGGDLFINGSVAQTIATGGGQFDLFGEAILANTAGLTITTAGGNVNFYGVLNSGNTYTYVDKTGSAGSGSWTAARSEARNGTGGGAATGDSYLATITSRLENSLASLAAGYRGAWIGAWRANPTGSYAWTWADGPEAGQNFFDQTSGGSNGTAVSGRFNNFAAVEPNGTLAGNESVAQFFGTAGQWNDLSPTTTYAATQASQYSVLGFVRETNLASSPLAINAGSGTVTIHGGVGGSKALASLNVQAASTTIHGNTLLTSGAQSYDNALTVNSASDLTVGATAITVTNAGQGALFKAAGHVVLNAGAPVTTHNGDITLWSDSDGSGDGAIRIGQGSNLNSANGATNASTGGGDITLGGGTATRTTAKGTAVPTGAAQASGSTPSAIAINAENDTQLTSLISGGGHISLRGNSSVGAGIFWSERGAVHAGNGTVTMVGNSSAGHGIELGAFGGSTTLLAGGGDAANAAIDLSGAYTGSANGYTGLQTNAGHMQATGAGGITVAAETPNLTGQTANNLGMDVLAASGPIRLSASGGSGSALRYLGKIGKATTTTNGTASSVTTSSSHVTLTADNVIVNSGISVDTTGALTVAPFNASFSSPLVWPLANLTLAPTLSGLTLGKDGNTADITVNSAHSIAGPIRLYGGNIAINADLSSTLAGAGILAKASGNIATSSGRSLQTNNGDITLWSDSDASGGGNIMVGSGNTLNTANGATGQLSGGGRITLAGGLDDGAATVASGRPAGDERPDGYAAAATTANSIDTGAGVSVGAGSNLQSGGGDVFIAGQGTSSTAGSVQTSGIWFWSGLVDSGAGKLALYGRNVATNNANNQNSFGIHLNTGSGDNTTTTLVSASSAADAIALVGDSSAGTTTGSSGLLAFFSNAGGVGTRIAATGGGGITLTGKGSTGPNATGTGALGDSIDLNFAQVLSTGGPITLNGTGGPFGISLGGRNRAGNFVTLGRAAGVTVNGQSMAASSANVVLNADALRVNAGASSGWAGQIASSGALTVQPLGASFTTALSWPAGLSLASDLSGLTLGKAGNTADISIASAVVVHGPVALYGGNLTLDAGLSAVGNTLTLQSSGTVSDGASGFVSADQLLLLGGHVALDNASTAVGTVAASGVGSLLLRNSSALAIGTVGGTSGIAASGPVDISTESGDLTLAGSVTTSNTGSNAVVLNAGRAAAAGQAAGGNIVAGGSPAVSTGAGGRATLYSGAIVGSTGLAGLVGNGRARYGSDESASNFSAVLGSGLYAVYREQPSVALTWNNQSVVYGTAPGAYTYTVTSGALHHGDAPTAAITGAVVSGAGHLAVAGAPYALTDSGALQTLGYSVSATAGTVTVTPRALTASYTGVARAYDGTTAATLTGTGDDRFSGDVLTVAGSGSFADQNAGTGKLITLTGGGLTGADAANYTLITSGSTATGDITPRTIGVSGAAVADKVYDGTTDATLLQAGQALTGVGSETLVLTATGAAFATADAGTGKTVTVSGYALANGTNGGVASNYQLASTTATTTADVAKAVLTVVANDDAKFVTLADAPGYNGVSYTGFVHGETAAVLGGAASISRSNAGTEGAGIYNGVLVADTSGLSATNYSFQGQAGRYTIVPSNQLLVRVNHSVGSYGTATVHSIASAEYFDGSAVVTLAGITDLGGNRFTISDGVGGSATLTTTATGAPLSTGGWTGVGAWQLGATNISMVNASNFSNTVTVVGSETVGAKAIAVNPTGGVSKVYDGTTAMPSISLQLSGAMAGDVLGVSAQGTFASRNAGSNLAYTVDGITLSGADAANYYLAGGTSFASSNGSITPRPLNVAYSGVSKVYDGNTVAGFTSSDDRIAGDQFSVHATAAFADKNVGSGKLVGITGALLSGGDAGNYTLASTGSTTADITRLASVAWIGGAMGNWFDPANWAGGAVPDLANVAGVVIPAGVVVSFDTAGAVAPAQTGPVQLDSLGGQGGSLVQNDGALNVGGGGVTLGGLTQNGGSLASDGPIVVNDFTQTGGSTSTQGDLTVNGNFAQGPNGTVAVQGDASILDTNGGTTIGNLQTGGGLAITSTDGAITQAPGTAIVVNGTTTLDAGASAITLDGAGNDFQGPFNASGGDITVVDGTGGLVIGNIEAGRNFDATSTGGAITQAPGSAIVVDGTTTVDAGTSAIALDGPNNDFQGPFNASGGDVTVVDGTGGLVVGNIDAGGNFDATSTGGDITQAPGSAIVVDSTTTVDAGTSAIALDGPNNDFQGPFNASGGDVTVVDGTGGLVIGNIDAGGNFDATSTGGGVTQQPGSAIVVDGTTTVDAGTSDIRLDGPNNDFTGPFNASGGAVTVVDGTGGLVVGNIEAGGNFDATSTGGGVTQAPGSAIVVDGTTTVDAGTSDIRLDGPNNYAGPFNASGGAVTVVDGSGGLVVGNIDAGGNFVATSTGGDITQQSGSAILVTGATTVDAGTDDIRLDGAGNDFVGRVDASGANVTLVDGRGGLVLGHVTASGRLEASSVGGNLTQATGTRLDVGGAAVLAAPQGAVQLTSSGNRFGGPLTVDAAVAPAPAQDAAMLVPPPPPVLVVPVLESAPPLLSETARFDAPITVAAPRAAASTGFSFALPLQLVGSVPAGTPIQVTLEDGSPLPAWLQFDEEKRTFYATAVPAGALPLTVAVRINGTRTLVRVVAVE